jgi:hypothetical protein
MVKFSVTFVPTHNVYVTITDSSSLGLPEDVVPSAVKFESAFATTVGGRVVVRGGRSFATEMGKNVSRKQNQKIRQELFRRVTETSCTSISI